LRVDIYEAVASRRAVRAFTGEPVPAEVLERVLAAAARAPSGGNIQPWNSYVLTGASLAELKKRTAERVAAGDALDEREFDIYPPGLKSPYRERRFKAGEQRYSALGIAREDASARAEAVAANWDCFGAPAALLCYIDRDMGPAQWGRRRHVPADDHAAASRRGAAQLPAEGVVGVLQDGRGGRFAAERAHAVLRHVNRVRGHHRELRPHRPRPAVGNRYVSQLVRYS
jgi:nitroreductase